MVVGEFTESADLVVIGGGPGGYVAAIRAAQLGRQVTLIEKESVGGVCLNVGCIPSKALISVADQAHQIRHAASRGLRVGSLDVDMAQVSAFKQGVVDRLTSGVGQLLKANRVTVLAAEARFVDDHHIRVVSEYESKKIEFRHAIIATGSRSRDLKVAPIDGSVVMGSTELLGLTRIPDHLVVIGGGYIGLELGTAFRKFGSEVTILEATASLLSGTDPGLVRIVERRLKDLGIVVHLNIQVDEVQVHDLKAAITMHQTTHQGQELVSDAVLVTVGRVPNTQSLDLAEAGVDIDERGLICIDSTLQTSNPAIFAIGDVVEGPMLAHKASYQGKIAAERLSDLPSANDAMAIPAVIFTDPEIATVGLSADQAEEQGYITVVGRFPFAANGRALSLSQGDGEAIVVAEKSTGLLLGIQVVGPEASSLIAEGTLSLEMGATLEDLALTIHAHPTLSEALMEAAEVALDRPIHVAPRRRS